MIMSALVGTSWQRCSWNSKPPNAAVARPVVEPGAVSWRTVSRELAAGLRFLAATRLLLTLLTFMLVLNLCLGADQPIIFLARDTLRLPPAAVGLVVTAGGSARTRRSLTLFAGAPAQPPGLAPALLLS